MKNAMGFFVGALAGAVVGVTLALLFAPRSGEELRQELNDRIEYVQNEVKLAAQQRRSELEQQLAELRAPRGPADVAGLEHL